MEEVPRIKFTPESEIPKITAAEYAEAVKREAIDPAELLVRWRQVEERFNKLDQDYKRAQKLSAAIFDRVEPHVDQLNAIDDPMEAAAYTKTIPKDARDAIQWMINYDRAAEAMHAELTKLLAEAKILERKRGAMAKGQEVAEA